MPQRRDLRVVRRDHQDVRAGERTRRRRARPFVERGARGVAGEQLGDDRPRSRTGYLFKVNLVAGSRRRTDNMTKRNRPMKTVTKEQEFSKS